jgi:uncharacterized membrane protein (DUF2068 family)
MDPAVRPCSRDATGTDAALRHPVKGRRNGILVAIAIFRLAKALVLLLLGLGALRLIHPGVGDALRSWFGALPFVTEHAAVNRLAATVTRLPPTRIGELAVAAFAYAGLFTTEGIGLLLGKRWAEWLTVIATASFIPFEIVEVVHKVTFVRISMVVVNAAIVAYLMWRRLTQHGRR